MKNEEQDAIIQDLFPASCKTCKKDMMVGSIDDTDDAECQNCYITKLEFLRVERDKDDTLGN